MARIAEEGNGRCESAPDVEERRFSAASSDLTQITKAARPATGPLCFTWIPDLPSSPRSGGMIASARQRFPLLRARTATFAKARLRADDLSITHSQPLRLPVARPAQ